LTWHETLLKREFERHLENTESISVLAEALKKIQSGFFRATYVDNFLQGGNFRKSGYDLKDALVFLQCHQRVMQGNIGHIQIQLPSMPFGDNHFQGNSNILTHLPPHFKARFWGGNRDGDGIVEWDEPWVCVVQKVDEANLVQSYLVEVAPGSLELEVGSIGRGKMPYYLSDASFGVARWPHGSDTMTLFVGERLFAGDLVKTDNLNFDLLTSLSQAHYPPRTESRFKAPLKTATM
jgi:hypothetical protein